MTVSDEVRAAVGVMRGYPAPWCVAGGWALDLFLGRVTRPHADVDLAIFRDDQGALRHHLAGWTLCKVENGRLSPWAGGERLELPVHEIHANRDRGEPTTLEFLLNEGDGDEWRYRRDLAVTLPAGRLVVGTPEGIPALCPEVVLLYKSRAARDVDEQDFRTVLPHLSADRRSWLARALEIASPGHPWIAELADGGEGR